jgi:hypothetical protein
MCQHIESLDEAIEYIKQESSGASGEQATEDK